MTSIDNIIAEHIKESAQKHYSDLERDINIEQSITNDYRGRAIFEFFQNAIDRAESNIWIVLDENKRSLMIANDGQGFSIFPKSFDKKSDFHALLTTHSSSKKVGESIGNKGVGFKSCWEYTQSVDIASIKDGIKWGFNIRRDLTSNELSQQFHNEPNITSWLNNEGIQQKLANGQNNGHCVPSFYFPKQLTNINELFSPVCFDNKTPQTIIRFNDIPKNKLKDLAEKIKAFAQHQLIFINQLASARNKNVVLTLKITPNQNSSDESEQPAEFLKTLSTQDKIGQWRTFEKNFTPEELKELSEQAKALNYPISQPTLSIALPLEAELAKSNEFHPQFYCYLPTEVRCAHSVIIHADFLLDVSRKQIDFNNNPYNQLLLNHAAQLFIAALQDNSIINLPHFALFLQLDNKSPFSDELEKQLFNLQDTRLLKSILKQAYSQTNLTTGDNINSAENGEIPQRCEHALQALKIWLDRIETKLRAKHKRLPSVKELEDKQKLACETFCDDEIKIIPTYSGVVPLSSRINHDNNINQAIFLKGNQTNDAQQAIVAPAAFQNIRHVTITDYNELEFLKALNYIKPFSTIEIIRQLTSAYPQHNSENFNIEAIYTDTLKLSMQLLHEQIEKSQSMNLDAFNKNAKDRNNSLLAQVSKIKFPCEGGKWRPARYCYTGQTVGKSILHEDFAILDLAKCTQIIDKFKTKQTQIYNLFGIWQVLPICRESDTQPIKLGFNISTQNDITTHQPNYKNLIAMSLPVWQQLSSNILDELKTQLIEQAWYFDEINQQFCTPKQTFLFNDQHKRPAIGQASKNHDYHDLHRVFEIAEIENTINADKLINALAALSKENSITTEHKTLYKQLVYRLARLDDSSAIKDQLQNLPVLVSDGKKDDYRCSGQQVYFVDREQKKHKAHLPADSVYLIADDNLSSKFAKDYLNCTLFNPSYQIIYAPENSKQVDTEFKQYLQSQLLAEMLLLAEATLGSKLEKTDVLQRWNQLVIYKADDVQLKINESKEHEGSNKDVLYKPLALDERSNSKDENSRFRVGEIAHDLEDAINSPDIDKFGEVFADAIFRTRVLGASLQTLLLKHHLTKTKTIENAQTDYLTSLGIDESDITETQAFIEQHTLSVSELTQFKELIDSQLKPAELTNAQPMDYLTLKFYQTHASDKTFSQLNEFVQSDSNCSEKIKNLFAALKPTNHHLLNIERIKDKIICWLYLNQAEGNKNPEQLEQIYRSKLSKLSDDAQPPEFDKFVLTEQDIYQLFTADTVNKLAFEDAKKQFADAQLAMQLEMTSDLIKVQDNSATAKSNPILSKSNTTHARKVSSEQRLTTAKEQQQRGIKAEQQVIYNALKLLEKELPDWSETLTETIEREFLASEIFKELDLSNFKDQLKQLQNSTGKSKWLEILQVSTSIGDGLGFDVILPEYSEGQMQLCLVEVKSSQSINDQTIYLSPNEISKIRDYLKNENWRLYHLIGNQNIDRTSSIRKAVNEVYEGLSQHQTSLIPDSWKITFA
ncbi:hypothetical protein DS2_09222 [Catenovulum agarivorans DS-2]|uniref:Protein NO VEIN C-terminal domain-containing protein n=1 Tax=Catenovulum agarivorans DS-2 TaxID=1328313 RepID=W7QXV1_9ALTE|nr:ATP-binding protein [Catenovulum agarivorans]EWH10115.1 hypothetical protein DS2_09222 [Catenovulum agarivorans DS-2]